MKAPRSSTTTTEIQAKGPTGKTATLVTPAVTPELLAASSTAKPTTTPGSTARRSRTPTGSQSPVSLAKVSGISTLAMEPSKVAKGSSAKGTVAKGKPTPSSSLLPLLLGQSSTLRKSCAAISNDSTPSMAVDQRTIACDITDKERTEVEERLANLGKRLKQVQEKGEKKNEIEEMIESYVLQCKKQMQTG